MARTAASDVYKRQIQGGHGNVEFLAHLKKEAQPQNLVADLVGPVVEAAHKEFKDE